MSLLIVGSIALDSIDTPLEKHTDMLGGSASYAAIAASFFCPVRLVGVVGTDFPKPFTELFSRFKIDTEGLKYEEGKTFRWHGKYEWDYNTRSTLSVDLNVFEKFNPVLPASYQSSPYVLLANIHPALQMNVFNQVKNPKFVVADTMDLWINIAQEDLRALLRKVDMLILNDSEAREFTKETSLIRAGRKMLGMGPQYVIIKKGEHGSLLFGDNKFFSAGAYPLEDLHDPTGAGDTFAGALMGHLAGTGGDITFEAIRKGIIYGSTLASFNVEAFSLGRLQTVTQEQISERFEKLKLYSQF
ncbi:MAG: PfkB family carbohydrate kinase [Verrucomicrobiae bacterium]|nr:PfkB family carbohydrate kinase [Verrucomicrobiae bacterium]